MNFSLKTLVLFLMVYSGYSFGQTAVIKGLLIDSNNNQAISGANIDIYALEKSEVSNSKGEFTIKQIPNGIYAIAIRARGFSYKTIYNIKIENGKSLDLDSIFLEAKIEKLKGGRVVFKRSQKTVAAGVQEQKNNEKVSNVITDESIKNTQDGDAAKVAARVPGVTLIEGRFIILRGLSQRYNSVQINNINAPSTEVDRRAFSFDLIPSNMLDKMVIFKSPSSDIAGDFAGGVIQLQTKSEVEEDFVSYQIGFGFRVNTSFQNHQNNQVNSFTDLFGFDNGNRALPSSFPSSLANYSTSQKIQFGKTLNNNFSLSNFKSPLDFGAGFGFGKNVKLKNNRKLFTVNNFSYSNNYQFSKMERYRYQNHPTEYVQQMFHYTDENFSIESKFNVLSNWIFEKNKRTTFTLKNLFNQIGENETTIRSGVNPTDRPNDEWKNYSYHYTSRSIYFGQFEGQHRINKKDKLIYTLGFSNIKRNEPDYRRFRTVRSIDSKQAFTMVDPPSANLFDAARFYSKLNESTYSLNLNYEKNFIIDSSKNKELTIRVGAYGESKIRTFDARWISYKYAGDPQLKSEFLRTPIDQIFSADNINNNAGLKPEEGTNPSDKYDAQNQLIVSYINASMPVKNFSFNFGVRYEYFNQILESADQNGAVNVALSNPNILPSINIAYHLNKKNLVRMAYGKTVNRPEFRELAPFVYYDFMYDVNVVGNPELKSAKIDNLDLRFENYPSKSETVSLGLFYKRFENPIENFVQSVGGQQFILKNAAKAENMGAELEFRKSFEDRTQNKFFKYTSVLLNASYIISKVDLGNDSTLNQARTRPLQGQSPYIINAALQYQNDSVITVNVVYNIYGKRIAFVGSNIFPTVYEMPRHAIDITVSKTIHKRMTIKFGVSDLLNFKHQLWQDTNADNLIDYKKTDTDHQLLEYRKGQMFTLSLSYKIGK